MQSMTSFEFGDTGYGIHWPLIDEDISIDGLLGIEHKPNSGAEKAHNTSIIRRGRGEPNSQDIFCHGNARKKR